VISILGILILPESPKFLYEKKRFDECREVFKYIAKFNKEKNANLDFKFDLEVELENKKAY
jgi:hypothetical protein